MKMILFFLSKFIHNVIPLLRLVVFICLVLINFLTWNHSQDLSQFERKQNDLQNRSPLRLSVMVADRENSPAF